MDKYSLKNCEIYKTNKIRPLPLDTAPNNIGRGQINYVTYTWSELEPARGNYTLQLLEKEIVKTINPILIIKPNVPIWLQNNSEDCFAKLIRRVGSSFNLKNNPLVGVVISTINDSRKEWNAYIEAFDNIPILADIHNYKLIQYLKDCKKDFGLMLSYCEDNWLECCEAFARQGLQNTWEKSPVLLHITDAFCGEHITKEALRWNAGISNLQMDLGFNITLRRLTYPKIVSSNEVLPIRFWFVNTGSAPCYRGFNVKIQLEQGDRKYIIPLKVDSRAWLQGDITHNEIVDLPIMREGTYILSVGIFYRDDSPMFLNIKGKIREGFYEMGSIDVDNENSGLLKNVWDDYYPEGYYPLEDPKAPEA